MRKGFMIKSKVLVVATSRKTRGGITSVIKAHENGEQWKKYHCRWIETHQDGPAWRKIVYLLCALVQFAFFIPFYDMVHIHTADKASATRKWVFASVAKLLRKKILVHIHLADERSLLDSHVNQRILKLLQLADYIIVLSPQWKSRLVEVMPEAESITHVLYNPCIPAHRDTTIAKKNQILLAGTICRRKGYDTALKGFSLVAKKYPDWKIVFAGNPYLLEGFDELEDGKRLAKEYGIEEQVEWLGWISGKNKERVFNETSIYCLASVREGFPMAVLDAWAYGLPCVMTPVGGIPDLVKDGEQGLLFPVGDSVKMAEALDKMMENENLRKHIVSQTDMLIETTLNIKTIGHQLDRIYQSILS